MVKICTKDTTLVEQLKKITSKDTLEVTDLKSLLKNLKPESIDIIILDLDVEDNAFTKISNLLKEVPNKPQLFIVYQSPDTQIRIEVWKRPEVIGYSSKSDPQTFEDITKVINTKQNRKETESRVSRDLIEIGSIEKIPGDHYNRSKFATLMMGKMREFVVDFKALISETRTKEKDICKDPFRKIAPSIWLDYMSYKYNPLSDDDASKEIQGKISEYIVKNIEGGISGGDKDNEIEKAFHDIFYERQKNKPHHILIEGETGTGKSLIADMIHKFLLEPPKGIKPDDYSPKFEKVTCTNIPDKLLEGELFGHISGAFTGANRTKHGRILSAYNGIVFLDEIGDMKTDLQAKLLTFLDDGRIEPIGWNGQSIYIPTTIVAATNKNLLLEARKGDFREDLYFRFTHRIYIPPMRERLQDMEYLVDFILQDSEINPQKDGSCIESISKDAIEKLRRYVFPGNYRELEYTLIDAVKRAKRLRSRVIIPEDIHFNPPSIPEIYAAFILPLIKNDHGDIEVLLQWNPNWLSYYFIGGRFVKRDRDLNMTITREIKKKIGQTEDDYTLKPFDNEYVTIQHSLRTGKKTLYRFKFFSILFKEPDTFTALVNQAGIILAPLADIEREEYQGRRISHTVKEVFDNLKAVINKLPDSRETEKR